MRTGSNRKVDVLPSEEEKLDDLDLYFLRLRVNGDVPEGAIPEAEGDTLIVEKSSKPSANGQH